MAKMSLSRLGKAKITLHLPKEKELKNKRILENTRSLKKNKKKCISILHLTHNSFSLSAK